MEKQENIILYTKMKKWEWFVAGSNVHEMWGNPDILVEFQ